MLNFFLFYVMWRNMMEVKKDVSCEERKSNLNLENRKKLFLTGVMEVISFNDRVIILNTCLGTLSIKGEGLKMTKLDVQNGDISVIGRVDSLIYTGSERKKDNETIIAKLFK